MKVVWIGAGNLATQLGVALARAGHETLQVFSRTEASASALAARLHCAATNRVEDILTGADVYVFSLKDSVLEELVARIAPRVGEAICLHTAGSMPMNLFKGYARRYGVLYPMQTFSKIRAVDFRSIPFFIEANGEEDMMLLKQILRGITEKVYVLPSEKRKYLHLAAVFACNFTNHMYRLSEKLLEEEGIPFEVMLPLIDETAAKVHELSPAKAQTGPAVRYDLNVIDRHLSMLKTERFKEIYRLLSENIHEEAK